MSEKRKRTRFAKESSVHIAKTRGEIEGLLRQWGCKKVGFLDHYDEQRVEIQFIWFDKEDNPYAARFDIDVTPGPRFNPKTGRDKSKERVTAEVRGRWRTLFYWLRGALDAVDAGIIEPEQVFLPWMMTAQGQTVSEVLLPQIKTLSEGSARALLGEGL